MAIGLESRVEAIVIGDAQVSRNAAPARLYELAVATKGASILSSGALATFSGEKTGRSPKDKRIVRSPGADDDVWWGPVNIPAAESSFLTCRRHALEFLGAQPRVYVVDGYAGWDPEYRVKVRVLCAPPTTPCSCTTCSSDPRRRSSSPSASRTSRSSTPEAGPPIR